jgi:hypothetical protein
VLWAPLKNEYQTILDTDLPALEVTLKEAGVGLLHG